MTSFFQGLWESIFTPGPTPTLLVATNATFGALQLILAALLASTRSIHFAVLSVLCGSLWWAINWFAREVGAHQAVEQAKEKERMVPVGQGTAATEDEADESETEVEEGCVGGGGHPASGMIGTEAVPGPVFAPGPLDSGAPMSKALDREEEISASVETVQVTAAPMTSVATTMAAAVAAATGVEEQNRDELKQRPVFRGMANQDTQSSASTEDEWEKVSENEGNRFS